MINGKNKPVLIGKWAKPMCLAHSLDQQFPKFFFRGAFFWTQFSHGALL
jgi:hypothetical protein